MTLYKALKTFRNSADGKMVGPGINSGEYEAPATIGGGHVKKGMSLELPGRHTADSAGNEGGHDGTRRDRGGRTGGTRRQSLSAGGRVPKKKKKT